MLLGLPTTFARTFGFDLLVVRHMLLDMEEEFSILRSDKYICSPGHWRRTWMHHGEAWRMPEAQPLAWTGALRPSLGAIFVTEMREAAVWQRYENLEHKKRFWPIQRCLNYDLI
jgi:hypothetical protein